MRAVLAEIGADEVPELFVVNKTDIAEPELLHDVVVAHPDAVAVSAVNGAGIPALLDRIADRLRALAPVIELMVPYDRGDVLAALHRDGEVLVEVHGEGGTRLRARMTHIDLARYAPFLVG